MLYERWRQIVDQNARELALIEFATNRRWTFNQLAAAAESGPASNEPFAFPQGISAEFILTLLRAWRGGQIVCPLEVEQKPPELAPPPAGIVHLKSTSASSGASRLVAFRPSQLTADADNIVATMGLRPDWPNLGAISLAHSYGFSSLVLPLLLHGIPLILLDSPLPESLRKALTNLPAVTLPAVPALWRAWRQAGVLAPTIRLAVSAGAPLLIPLEREVFADTGIKIHNFYGASECGGITYDSSDIPRSEIDSVGTALRNVTLSINSFGCLTVQSSAVAEAYWPRPHSDLVQSRYQTNDLAEIKNGQVYLRGRAGDLINVAGRKVAPEQVENALRMHPHVRNCLVFGIPSAESARTDVIVACVETNTPAETANLRAFLLKQLPAWQLPREWWFTPLEQNIRGKVSRAVWREKYLSAKGGPILC